jgi:hypothetical protein
MGVLRLIRSDEPLLVIFFFHNDEAENAMLTRQLGIAPCAKILHFFRLKVDTYTRGHHA